MLYRSFPTDSAGAWTYVRAQAHPHPPVATRQRSPLSGFTIAIASEAGIDAGNIAQAVGHRLGYPVWDHELLSAVAERLHTRASALEPLDETHVSWLQESLEAFLDPHTVTQVAYVHQLVHLIETLGAHGDCVIVGRGAAHVLPLATTLRVRLVAPLDDRVTMMSRLAGIDRSHAMRKVAQAGRNRNRFIRDRFHKDPTDPANYDLLLNVARLTADDCALQIIDALHAEQEHRAARA